MLNVIITTFKSSSFFFFGGSKEEEKEEVTNYSYAQLDVSVFSGFQKLMTKQVLIKDFQADKLS